MNVSSRARKTARLCARWLAAGVPVASAGLALVFVVTLQSHRELPHWVTLASLVDLLGYVVAVHVDWEEG